MAFYVRRLRKLYLYSTDAQFCHKDVAKLIDESVENGLTRPKITVYDSNTENEDKRKTR